MISIKNLTKVFLRDPIFDNYSAEFRAQRVCVEAANGLGKSTLFTLIAGVDRAYQGKILFDNKEYKEPQKVVALASDAIVFPDFLTAQQVLAMTMKSWNCAMPDELISVLQFSSFLNTRVCALSSGNLKKLQLINAIMRNTPYLILDEPSAALDTASVNKLVEYLNTSTNQILMSCHDPDVFMQIGFEHQPLFAE
ncbi:ATP-binding cassette domain-containing protein [Pseudoalteromonas luteoviolacea]|uniref:ABC transporter ATP-binding protein n=1 Tax=Pseudoalteromonas luteoviolacea TaxID=43657 RepID=UPI001B35C7B8|nr:ATP-binding cassette domain-containing protein [Pseudoalteromonas luteoviolacea]MBQ4814496.1 ATP-binding cassette domain-containing protein [Pseudoalteromonas luteoviolacea]